jgi:hypothetical protein
VATIECDWHGLTSPYGPGALFCCFWFPPSQGPKRAALSQEPETAWRPSGVTVTALAESVWPWNVVLVSPLARSQTRSVVVAGAGDRVATRPEADRRRLAFGEGQRVLVRITRITLSGTPALCLCMQRVFGIACM